MKNLCVKDVSVIYPGKTAGERVHALDNINLTINSGDFVVALGASGCGKTTLLSLMLLIAHVLVSQLNIYKNDTLYSEI